MVQKEMPGKLAGYTGHEKIMPQCSIARFDSQEVSGGRHD